MLAVLRQRRFGLLWFGQLISGTGDWVLWIALPFYVQAQTQSALATGTVFALVALPRLVFGSVAGVFVDRWDRRRTMIAADLARAAIVLGLLAARSPEWLWVIYPLAFLESTISQFFGPAKNAFIPRVVEHADLNTANTLNQVADEVAMIGGSALGGMLLALLGLTSVVLVDTASYLVSALMISLIAIAREPARPHVDGAPAASTANWRKVGQDWLAGLQMAKSSRLVSTLFVMVGVTTLGQGVINVLWPAFIDRILHGSALEYGWVQVAVGLGSISGGFLVGHIGGRMAPSRLIAPGGLLLGLTLFATFNLPFLPVILGLQFLTGIAGLFFFIPARTLLQTSVADRYLGRTFGAYATANALLLLVGEGLAGALGDRLGIVPGLSLAAVLYFSGGVVALVLLPGALRASGSLATARDPTAVS